jgi:hypothetical protein
VGSKFKLINSTLESETNAVIGELMHSTLFENVIIKNATTAITLVEPSTNIFMKNISITTNKESETIAFLIQTSTQK